MAQPREHRTSTSTFRAVAASTVGTIVEWYDYAIYGTAAALVFGKLFFPTFDPVAGQVAAFATFAVGYIARPVGGMFFAHIGDKYGRKPTLIATLSIMGLSSAAIGLLPTYGSIGIAAPILLVCLRLIQGFGAGAELCGAMLFSAEDDPAKRGWRSSWPAAASDVSFALATGLFFFASSLTSSEQFLSWGWRALFLVSLVAVLVGYLVRRDIPDTEEFVRVQEERRVARVPLWEVIVTQPRMILVGAGVSVMAPIFYIYAVYMVSYITRNLGISASMALGTMTAVLFCSAAMDVFLGFLSDRIARWKILFFGAAFSACFAFPLFMLLDTRQPVIIAAALFVGVLVGRCPSAGINGAYQMDLFEARLRFSGMILSREITGALIGGLLPLAATVATAAAGGAWWPVALIMIGMGAVTMVALLFGPTRAGALLPAARPLQVSLTSGPEGAT